MAKRPSNAIADINEEAKRMAVTWTLKELTDKAAKERHRPQRAEPKCKFCNGNHHTGECHSVSIKEKLEIVKEKDLCLLCLNYLNHHAAACRALKSGQYLCKAHICAKNFTIHHATLCEKSMAEVHHIRSNSSEEKDSSDDEDALLN